MISERDEAHLARTGRESNQADRKRRSSWSACCSIAFTRTSTCRRRSNCALALAFPIMKIALADSELFVRRTAGAALEDRIASTGIGWRPEGKTTSAISPR